MNWTTYVHEYKIPRNQEGYDRSEISNEKALVQAHPMELLYRLRLKPSLHWVYSVLYITGKRKGEESEK